MSDFSTDNNLLVQELLQERDELFQKLCRLQKINEDALGGLEAQNKELSSEVAQKDQEIKKLTDQLAWFRQKYFSKSSEKFIKEDPNQRKLDFDGLEILPEEVTAVKEADKQIAEYERRKVVREKKKPVRLPIPEGLRREIEVIEPEGLQADWVRIGVEITTIASKQCRTFSFGRADDEQVLFSFAVLSSDCHAQNDRLPSSAINLERMVSRQQRPASCLVSSFEGYCFSI